MSGACWGSPTAARREALTRLRAASDFLPRVLRAHPAWERWLLRARDLERPLDRERICAEALRCIHRALPTGVSLGLPGAAALDLPALERALVRFKYRHLARIAYRDAGLGAPVLELGQELAILADAIVQAALAALTRGSGSEGFCVLGLGKLGGEDLNFSSDIDLVFVSRGAGAEVDRDVSSGSGPAHTQLAQRLTRLLSAVTTEGFLYRVDLNLRPLGRSGALVSSLAGFTQYYETLGRAWERSALVKARCIAGDAALGEEVLEALRPFIWRKSLDLSAVDALREVKAQIDLRSRASQGDVKLGKGGIREVEFFVSALQLVHGGKEPALRGRHTVQALRSLVDAGHLTRPLGKGLEAAYIALRRTENFLQMREERQTQTLPSAQPEAEADWLHLSRALGFASPTALQTFLQMHQKRVHHAFASLLGQLEGDSLPDEPLLAVAIDPGASDDTRRAALEARGFAHPEPSLARVDALLSLRDSQLGARGAPGVHVLQLLAEVAATPDPDQALFFLTEFLQRARAPQGYLALLTRWPRVRQRLFNLFGQSEYLARAFLRSPELLDVMWDASFEQIRPAPGALEAEVHRRAATAPAGDERLSLLRRIKNEELLRVGAAELTDELTAEEAGLQLTTLAEALLEQCLQLAEAELRERYHALPHPGGPGSRGPSGPGSGGLAVIGMGKLGGRELAYHSDLDLLFVYAFDSDAETAGGARGRLTFREYAARLAQRFLAFLQLQLREGALYEIDARLRPSGNQGMLVVSERAFQMHHEERAQLWERQALIKARPVAGDIAFGQALLGRVRDPLVYERPLPADAARQIHRLRERMERERSGESAERYNPKLGRGGLTDVEFAVQWLQLKHGGALLALREPHTLRALQALEQHGILAAPDAAVLREGYRFMRRTESRLRLGLREGTGLLPASGPTLRTVARRLGYAGPEADEAFRRDYCDQREAVRSVYTRLVAPTE